MSFEDGRPCSFEPFFKVKPIDKVQMLEARKK